jgi:type II secretory pathway predicted ATPase ExeA/ankyrin repeat protein
MYVSYFGCREHPFHITPDPRFFYGNDTYEEAYANLLYGIRERKGFIVLTGEVGTGKTLLLRRLMDDIQGSVQFVFLYNTHLTFEEMLDFICQDFELPLPPHAGRLQKIQALNQFLLSLLTAGGTGALLIDEAQNLSDEVLENLRLLSNLETSQEKLLQIVLVGQPELDRKLAQPHLRQLKQRIVLWSRLGPLPDREVGPFIRHRLRIAGCERQDLFSLEAIQRIALYAKGAPRLINVICDNALLIAYASSQARVTADMIEEVAIDLGLREGGRTLTWQLSHRAQSRHREPLSAEQHPAGQTSTQPATPSSGFPQVAVAMEEPPPTRSSMPPLAEEKSASLPQAAKNPSPQLSPALGEAQQSRSRQAWFALAATLLILTSLSIIHFSLFPRKEEQRVITVWPDSAAQTQDRSSQLPPAVTPPENKAAEHQGVGADSQLPSAVIPSENPHPTESSLASQTHTPGPVSTNVETLSQHSSLPISESPIPQAAPSSPPSLTDSHKTTAFSPSPPTAAKTVGVAILPTPGAAVSPPKSLLSSLQNRHESMVEKGNRQSRQEPALPQATPEKPQPENIRKEERARPSEQKQITASQREEARAELANRGIPNTDAALLTNAERGDVETLGLLLVAGASPNATAPRGWSALMLATMHGQTAAVRALLAGGADANAKNEAGGTALMLAAIKGQQEILQLLLDSGAAINVGNKEGWTPLMYAAWNGHAAAVRALVNKGAEVNAQNQEGWTPLMCAAWKGNTETVQTLLNRGASAQPKNKDGETASHLAARRDHSEIVRLLKPANVAESSLTGQE